ncbi:MAG TPA: helix-turn-helix transcriptional regulator [Actinomycetota bacterium]|nr:helix-turn-helix transcriptional regulator [Actinomycetota bacterium]
MPASHEGPDQGDASFPEGLGRAVQVARTELGMTRKELAQRAGLSYAHVADIETGRGLPSMTAVNLIAQALGMSLSELLARAELYTERLRTGSLPGEGERWEESATRPGWFHRASLGPAPAVASPERGAPVPSRPRSRSALTAEILTMLEELPERDLPLVLELVRRLAAAAPPRAHREER